MQVKKFEAPTIQEALEHIKRELGPEAIILQTKQNKKAFGLLSKPSFEVTAAVSEKSLQKKKYTDNRLPDSAKEQMLGLSARRQAEIYDRNSDRRETAKQLPRSMDAGNRDVPGSSAPRTMATSTASSSPLSSSTPRQADTLERVRERGVPVPILEETRFDPHPLEEEVRHLKRMLQEMRESQEVLEAEHEVLRNRKTDEVIKVSQVGAAGSMAGSLPSDFMPQGILDHELLRDAFEELVLTGVDRKLAHQLVKKAAFSLGDEGVADYDHLTDQLATEIMSEVKTLSILPNPKKLSAQQDTQAQSLKGEVGAAAADAGKKGKPQVVVLLGPTGVGKTTTVAKVASQAQSKLGLRVGLINLDQFKVAAFDQLATYGKILKAPFRSVGNREDFQAALEDFSGLDLVLVDTTGRSHRDRAPLMELRSVLEGVENCTSHLLLSATTRDPENLEILRSFKETFTPESLLFSKLDEAATFGSILNIHRKSALPLSFFMTGQRVPEDLEDASPERLSALVLGIR
jgi:flagellar biosynthesis protein FlhF